MAAKYHILLVEDNQDHAALIRSLLLKIKNITKVTEANDGQSALETLFRLKNEKNLPHLILLDLKLPKIDGLELLKILRENRSLNKITTIIISTSDNEEDMQKALALGANQYIVKPSDFKNLSREIEIIINTSVNE